MTSGFAVLGLMGPRSRALLGRVSTADLSSDAFPFATSREIDVGPAWVRATRVSFVGELGWELTIPAELAEAVHTALCDAGRDLGLGHAGHFCLDGCRNLLQVLLTFRRGNNDFLKHRRCFILRVHRTRRS